jgi:hypothetical protein
LSIDVRASDVRLRDYLVQFFYTASGVDAISYYNERRICGWKGPQWEKLQMDLHVGLRLGLQVGLPGA